MAKRAPVRKTTSLAEMAKDPSPETREIPSDRMQAKGGYPQYGGKTLRELMWEPIDAKMDELMDPAKSLEDEPRAEIIGFLRGACTVYAVFQNAYLQDVDAMRHEAMRRWKYRHFKSEVWE